MSFSNKLQQTLSQSCTYQGIGLHTGKMCKIQVSPAEANHGIIFKRMDIAAQPLIKAHYKNISDTFLCTKLTDGEHGSVGVVEHLMAALASCGIDNVLIEVEGPEIPLLDGSARPFIDVLREAGIQTQPYPRQYIQVLKEIRVEHQDQWIQVSPADHFSLEVTCDLKGRQGFGSFHLYFNTQTQDFYDEIAAARSYGFYEDAAMIQGRGLSLGASLENIVVIDQGKIMNPEGLRFEDEFVRHKILDAVGDLYLAGFPLKVAYQAYNPGHMLNHKILQALFDNQENWILEKNK